MINGRLYGDLVANPLDFLSALSGDLTQIIGDRRGDFCAGTFPHLEVSPHENGASISVQCPGIKADELQVELEGRVLTIKGERRSPYNEETKLLRRERSFGSFSRAIEFSFTPDADKINATFRDGMLVLEVPKIEVESKKRIAVKG